jgi:hypothetical protein
MLSATSGSALIPLAVVLGLGAAAWSRWNRRQDARFYGMSAGAVAVVSLALVTWHGFARAGDPAGATWVYGLYAMGALVAVASSGRRAIGWTACGLLLAAIVQGVVYRWSATWGLSQPLLAALLTFGTTTALGRLAFSTPWLRGPADVQRQAALSKLHAALADPLRLSACGAAILATSYWLWLTPRVAPGTLAGYAFWLAAVWLALAVALVSATTFWVFQATLSVGVVFAVAARLATHAWYGQARYP